MYRSPHTYIFIDKDNCCIFVSNRSTSGLFLKSKSIIFLFDNVDGQNLTIRPKLKFHIMISLFYACLIQVDSNHFLNLIYEYIWINLKKTQFLKKIGLMSTLKE